MNLLSIQSIKAAYGAVVAVRDVSLILDEGEAIALVGSNGAGKSSTLKAIMGLLPLAGGSISLRGEDMRGLRTPARVRAGLSLAPEGRQVFGDMTVRENLEMGFGQGSSADFDTLRDEMFVMFPRLAERVGQPAGTLSGGEQQMLAIARALMSKPRILMLDEPTLGLAPLMVELVTQTLHKLKARGIALLLAEQNLQMAFSVADRGYVLETGTVVATGPVRELAANPRVREAYLGLEA
jgi:branched-chain amino acid transport system ATP-binding protein